MLTHLFKSIFTLALLAICGNAQAQATSDLNQFLTPFVEGGFAFIRQDYQLVNPDNDRVFTKDNMDYYGRVYSIAVRTTDNNYIVLSDVATPWSKDKSLSGDKFVPVVSNTAYRTINATEWEKMSFEECTEIIPERLFSMPGSDESGFQIDTQYGRKRGFAVWVKTGVAITETNDLSRMSIEVVPMNIRTKEEIFVYDIPEQPTDAIGGFYLVPVSEGTGTLVFKVNGLFSKIGGIWKFISLGVDMPDDY